MFLGLLLLVLALEAAPASGQAFLPDPVEQPAFAVQWERPFLPGTDGLKAYSSLLELDAILPWRPGRSVQIGIPLAIAGVDGVDRTSIYAGNLRATILFGEPGAAATSFVGITLPTGSNLRGPELAVLIGALPWLDELEKWVEDAVAVRGGVMPAWPLASGGQVGLRLGGAAIAPTDWENLHVYARAAGWGRVPTGRAELRADLGTSYSVTDDDGFGRQFTSYLTLGAGLPEVSGHPGMFIRIPLDGDARQVLDLSIGLSARF